MIVDGESRSARTDYWVTALMLAGYLGGALAIEHGFEGAVSEQASQVLRGFGIFMATVLVYSILERLGPGGPHKSARAYAVNLQVNLLYSVSGALAGASAALLAGALSHHFNLGLIDLQFVQGKGLLMMVGAILVGNLVFDFFYYWFHRVQHMSPFLWQQHKIHHMDEQLDALTTGRQHWLEEFFRIPIIAIPMAVLFKLDKVDLSTLGMLGSAVGWVFGSWAVFIHANLRLHLGWLGAVFAGPQVHRVHHSRLVQHHDRNFAAFFPVWDVLFGTYFSPRRDEFPPTGVDGEREFRTLGEMAMLPFREWKKMLRAPQVRKVA